jgi:hypothetical protein
VGGACGSVNLKSFKDNMNELHVIESKRNAIRKGFDFELLNAQDADICSYFAKKLGEWNDRQNPGENGSDVFQGLSKFE